MALPRHHVTQHFHVFLIISLAHGHVAITAHTYGDKIVKTLIALQSVTEELVEVLLISGIVPCAYFLAALGVLLVGTHHGLMVGSAHDDAIPVGQDRILRIVLVEGGSPHGGPEIVGLQTQQKLKQVGVHLGIQSSELPRSPSAKRRPLVIDENAAIFHFRRRLHIASRGNI